jgi:hypothetical protein
LTNTRLGIFKFGYLNDPSVASAALTISQWQIKDFSGFSIAGANDPGTGLRISNPINGQIGTQRYSSSQDTTIGLPVWRVLLNYAHNLTVQNASSLAGGASEVTISFDGQEYRQYVAANANIQVQHAKAPEFTVNTQIVNLSDATTEANAQLALRSVARVIVTVPLDPSIGLSVNLLSVVQLQIPRFGWSAGKNFLVIGMTEDYGANAGAASSITLTLWG